MKRFLLIGGFILSFLFVTGQTENGVRVAEIINPTPNLLYGPNDSSIFVVRIKNDGPFEIIAGDQFKIKYSLTNASGTGEDFDTLLTVGGTGLAVGQSEIYTIDSSIHFNGSDTYSACADLTQGTVLFPMNSNKFSGKCRTFTVSLEKIEVKFERIFYHENTVYFNINKSSNYEVEIFDITGKLMTSRQIKNTANGQLNLNAPAKGFYFLKLKDLKSGNSKAAKFVVN